MKNDTHESLNSLEIHQEFETRHIAPVGNDVDEMLAVVGVSDFDELIKKTIPNNILINKPLDLDAPLSERDTLSYIRKMKDRNQVYVSMIGMGYYGTVTPPVIRRNVLENPAWYTAYTPYQAEVSQGRLEPLLNFQQMIIDLTGMEIANASMLDESTAAAEAMMMSKRVSKTKSNRFFVSDRCHPQTINVVQTRAKPMDIEVIVADVSAFDGEDYFGILLQYPDTFGSVDNYNEQVTKAQANKVLVTVATDLLALTLLTPPGEWGADIVVGNSQRFGVPMAYGGPHAAFMATKDAFKRSLPGRLIGVSVDARGKMALRMALQTREQHIRRDKATSNICTAQVLLALIAVFYACYHGPKGLKLTARRVNRLTTIAAKGLQTLGFKIVHDHYFDTLCVHTPGLARRIAAKAREARVNLRIIDADHLGISIDETTRRNNIETLWQIFSTSALKTVNIDELDSQVTPSIPSNLSRTSEFLTHPAFNTHHSETEMMRYLRKLSNKDIALDRSMIALGSCTMKLNAATEMIPITFKNFSSIHPFVPLEQAQGYQQLFEETEQMLCAITGFDRISFQPNAGSQGEYTGLLCIRQYHEANKNQNRNICLIPSSAHGTNPASAVMAGYKVIVVKSDDKGNVDVADLEAKAIEHSESLGALMITYPSTHGVFEQEIIKICQIIHDHGGQVYLDGANLNAMVGLCQPGQFGADVMHMNLHKTFCIPHGGGGPGAGPIGVKAHLAKYLPSHPVVDGVNPDRRGDSTVGSVAGAPWGSAGILQISWAYIKLMGSDGLKRASEQAILSANYIAKKLEPYYDIVYKGHNGFVAHECIIDLRDFKDKYGIGVEDVAKRLIDYGFHAPTMSFPISDTLMIEPTESEPKHEMDRFCEAMIEIFKEVQEAGKDPALKGNNPLVNAPHTYDLLIAENWDRPYSKKQAFFPLAWINDNKFWPPVARVDNVYGDKHLICSCPPIEAYMYSDD